MTNRRRSPARLAAMLDLAWEEAEGQTIAMTNGGTLHVDDDLAVTAIRVGGRSRSFELSVEGLDDAYGWLYEE
jgi:hypothetical protein